MFVRVTPREAKSLLDLPACKKNVSRLTWQPWCGYIYRWQARKFIQISFTPPGEWGAGGWIHRFSTKHSAKQSVELMDLEAQRTSYLQFDWKTFLCFVAGINAKREEKKTENISEKGCTHEIVMIRYAMRQIQYEHAQSSEYLWVSGESRCRTLHTFLSSYRHESARLITNVSVVTTLIVLRQRCRRENDGIQHLNMVYCNVCCHIAWNASTRLE